MKTTQEILAAHKNNDINFIEATRALRDIDACECDLCLRYGVLTVATTERLLDEEYRSTKAMLPVCDDCAHMLDNA